MVVIDSMILHPLFVDHKSLLEIDLVLMVSIGYLGQRHSSEVNETEKHCKILSTFLFIYFFTGSSRFVRHGHKFSSGSNALLGRVGIF